MLSEKVGVDQALSMGGCVQSPSTLIVASCKAGHLSSYSSSLTTTEEAGKRCSRPLNRPFSFSANNLTTIL